MSPGEQSQVNLRVFGSQCLDFKFHSRYSQFPHLTPVPWVPLICKFSFQCSYPHLPPLSHPQL